MQFSRFPERDFIRRPLIVKGAEPLLIAWAFQSMQRSRFPERDFIRRHLIVKGAEPLLIA